MNGVDGSRLSAFPRIDDRRVVRVPVLDSGEGLQRCPLPAGPGPVPPYDRRVRAGVAARLERAALTVHRAGLVLAVVEGFRSAAVQRRLHDEYRARLAVEHPDWSSDAVAGEAALFASPPRLLAPHRTGGAVDVLLLTMRDEVVDMGCPVDATPLGSGNRCFTDSGDIGAEARLARGLLVAAMSDAGFVNYPSEWWHWSYGDQYWAFVSGAPHAVYGAAE